MTTTTRTDNRGGMLVAGLLIMHWNEDVDNGLTRTRRTRRERRQPPTQAESLDLQRVLPEGVASCASTDPESWHPEKRQPADASLARICGGCDLREACLEYALDHPDLTGIWAGTTVAERKRMRLQ